MPALRCAYCHDTAGAWTRSCERCGSLLHDECWRDLEECPTLGCGSAVEVPPKQALPATRWRNVLVAAAASFLLIGGLALAAMDSQRAIAEFIPLPVDPDPVEGPVQDLGPSLELVDVSHVRVGQRYQFHMTPSPGTELDMVWEVTELTGDELKYSMQVFMRGKPIGEPTEQVWTVPAVAETQDWIEALEGPPAPFTDTIEVAGRTWECWVVESAGYRTWAPKQTFPPYVRQTKDGKIVNELTRIEEPFLETALEESASLEPLAGDEPVEGVGPSDRQVELPGVRVGQRYHYRIPQTHRANLDTVWEVTGVGENEVSYTSTTLMGGSALGPAKARRWFIPRTITPPLYGDSGAPPTETIQAAGRTWECWVTECDGVRTWTPRLDGLPFFPSYVKQMKGGELTAILTRIEEP